MGSRKQIVSTKQTINMESMSNDKDSDKDALEKVDIELNTTEETKNKMEDCKMVEKKICGLRTAIFCAIMSYCICYFLFVILILGLIYWKFFSPGLGPQGYPPGFPPEGYGPPPAYPAPSDAGSAASD